MAVQVTIIGLGQVGASIGLALTKIKDQVVRIGNDRDPGIARMAEKMGAIDKISYNLPSAVEHADLVILAVPVDEVRDTIKVIAPDLKAGSVLIDLSPVKGQVMQWAAELIREPDRYFAALTPSLNPVYLMETGEGVEFAHADLFQNSLMLITTMPGIDDSALNLITTLTQLLGAEPLFTDTFEADGLMAYTAILPRLVAAAIANSTMDQPGWREARKLAGHAYAQITEPVLHPLEGKNLGLSALHNPDNTVRMIDMLVNELMLMRELIANQDSAALQARLEQARAGREKWLSQRHKADWEPKPGSDVPLPTSGEVIGRIFGGKLLSQRKDKDKK